MRFAHTKEIKQFRLDGYATDTVTSERFKIAKFDINDDKQVVLVSPDGELHLLSACNPGPSNKSLFKRKHSISKRRAVKAGQLVVDSNGKLTIIDALASLKTSRKERKRHERTVRQKKRMENVTYRRINPRKKTGKKSATPVKK